MCQFIRVRLGGMILMDGHQALLVNSVEVYCRFRTLDAHHEHFNVVFSDNSLSLLSNMNKSDIRITKIGKKSTLKSNWL
jgi:hypothetical protein